MDISDRIRFLIKERGFTQKQFAEKVGLSQSFISALSSNRKSPNLETLELICNALDISLSDFFRPFDSFSTNLTPYVESLLLKCKRMSKEHIKLLNSIASHLTDQVSFPDEVEFCVLPLLGSAAAGDPLHDPAFPEESVMVPKVFADPNLFFAIQAKGDSMSPRIMDGDYVIVKHRAVPELNDIVLIRSSDVGDDGYAIKVLKSANRMVSLRSINPSYPLLTIPAEGVSSLEKVVHIIHRGVV